jgi:hypothetical protein
MMFAQTPEEKLRFAFEICDRDANGVVDQSEFCDLIFNILAGVNGSINQCFPYTTHSLTHTRSYPPHPLVVLSTESHSVYGRVGSGDAIEQGATHRALINETSRVEFSKADTDGDGVLSVAEFVVAGQQQPQLQRYFMSLERLTRAL